MTKLRERSVRGCEIRSQFECLQIVSPCFVAIPLLSENVGQIEMRVRVAANFQGPTELRNRLVKSTDHCQNDAEVCPRIDKVRLAGQHFAKLIFGRDRIARLSQHPTRQKSRIDIVRLNLHDQSAFLKSVVDPASLMKNLCQSYPRCMIGGCQFERSLEFQSGLGEPIVSGQLLAGFDLSSVIVGKRQAQVDAALCYVWRCVDLDQRQDDYRNQTDRPLASVQQGWDIEQ